MIRRASACLTAVEMNHADVVQWTSGAGVVNHIALLDTGARIIETTLTQPGREENAARTIYGFWADVDINGRAVRIEREIGTQNSFYEPVVIDGMLLWLDAVDAIFTFMHETHSPCRTQENCAHGQPPRRQARLALQDATARICPDKLQPWCPLPAGGLKIEDCYRGEDCWLGAYDGASAHGGLDINHPAGTPLFAPIALDHHFLYHSIEMGHNNNRWRGFRRWPDGSEWVLTTCHMIRLTVE